MPSRWHLRQRQRYACQCNPTSVLLRKGHRIRVALAGAHASLFEQSSCGTRSLNRALAAVVLMPAVSNTSFIATGTPCSGSRHTPLCSSDSAWWASSNADSAVTVIKALSKGLSAFITSQARSGYLDGRDSLLFQQSCDLIKVQTGDSTAAVVPAAFGIEASPPACVAHHPVLRLPRPPALFEERLVVSGRSVIAGCDPT
jgi:hypothetical protein